jgi:drug/metabolite transporter (DMT)-like permease
MMACFGYAFKNADTFFRMWFIGSGLLAVFGWMISFFFFKEAITIYQALGAAAIVVGTIFIGK